jgi:CheY-like chemotaxis protein
MIPHPTTLEARFVKGNTTFCSRSTKTRRQAAVDHDDKKCDSIAVLDIALSIPSKALANHMHRVSNHYRSDGNSTTRYQLSMSHGATSNSFLCLKINLIKPEPQKMSTHTAATQARKKILLVDDTVTMTALEKLILGSDYDYIEARNGHEAFARAFEAHPDLALMDLIMPVHDGVDGLRRIKGEPSTAAIPVVMVTTRSEQSSESECRSLGCADCLTKPIDQERLRATVRRLVG